MNEIKCKEWERLSYHDLANTLPTMPEPEFDALKADIAQNGLQESIVLFEGRILDGRHRFRACKELSEERKLSKPPRFIEFRGTREEALAFVASLNMLRRHLSKSQKAMVLIMAGLVAPPGGSGKRRTYGTGRDAIMEIGRKYGVNHMTLYRAAYVHARDPELAKRVITGEYSVPAAERIIREREVGPAQKDKRGSFLRQEIEAAQSLLEKAKPRADAILAPKCAQAWRKCQEAIQEFSAALAADTRRRPFRQT